MTTRHECPACGLVFVREYGYFVGAMYASYFIGIISTAYWIPLLLMGVSPWLVIGIPLVHLTLQIPLSFRYGRIIWLYIDHGFDPDWARPEAQGDSQQPLRPGPQGR